MKVKDMKVELCNRRTIRGFIMRNHYSGSINGCAMDYCFSLTHEEKLIGAAFFGRMAMVNQWKKYGEKEEDVIELRRLCCIDETPKNTESYFISRMLKWLKKNTSIKAVVSYADAEYGHSGIIYRASNFEYLGFQKGAKIIIWNGKRYHDKAIRTKHNGKLKPFAEALVVAIESGAAKFQETAGKHTYLYRLQ